MKYIENLKDGENLIGHYLCKQKQTLKSKAGKNYLSLILYDRTGQIDAKVWELNNNIQSFEENDFIKIEAAVQLYQSELQLRITKIRKSTEGEYDPSDYIPTIDKDVDSLFAQLIEYIKSISNPYIKQLLENIFNQESIKNAFKKNSAAKVLHHSYMGGLLEHTLSVVQLCDFVSGRYLHINRDILIASAALHDLGKIYELSPFPDNDYTDEGQLLGHIVMCSELIAKEASKIDGFPEKLKTMLRHCILAHHGEYEYGSPKLPHTIEAYVLHLCDNMDAKIKAFEESISNDKSNLTWIGYNKMLGRNIRKSNF